MKGTIPWCPCIFPQEIKQANVELSAVDTMIAGASTLNVALRHSSLPKKPLTARKKQKAGSLAVVFSHTRRTHNPLRPEPKPSTDFGPESLRSPGRLWQKMPSAHSRALDPWREQRSDFRLLTQHVLPVILRTAPDPTVREHCPKPQPPAGVGCPGPRMSHQSRAGKNPANMLFSICRIT